MTLQEKLKKEVFSNCDYLEQVADDFAIGFAIWCVDYTYHKSFDVWIKNNNSKAEKFTRKELLEIYKKEKGLC